MACFPYVRPIPSLPGGCFLPDGFRRRLNRAGYNNTIRDLPGVDCPPAGQFPEDPPSGGFDNNGQSLTMSPMQLELYYAAARQILDRALVEGPQPAPIRRRFEPEENNREGMPAG